MPAGQTRLWIEFGNWIRYEYLSDLSTCSLYVSSLAEVDEKTTKMCRKIS